MWFGAVIAFAGGSLSCVTLRRFRLAQSFLGIENRPLEHDVHPWNVWERGPAPPSPSLSPCPSFSSFTAAWKGIPCPSETAPHSFITDDKPSAPTSHAASLNPGLPTLQPAVSNASGFTRGKSDFGEASNSTPAPQTLHTHSRARWHFAFLLVPVLLFRSLQNPSETSWLMAASVHLRPLQLGQSLQWGTATLRLAQLLFLFFPRTRWRLSVGLAKTFCVLSAEMWHTVTPRPNVGGHTRCRQGAEDPRSNQSTLSCLVCACLSLQEGCLLLFWRATPIQALSASAESSGGVILRLTTEIASTRIAAEKEKPTACSDLIPQPH